jgi:hypothetical protein
MPEDIRPEGLPIAPGRQVAPWHAIWPLSQAKKNPAEAGFFVLPETMDQKRYCAEMP